MDLIPLYLLGAAKLALAIATVAWTCGCANHDAREVEPDSHFSEFSP